MLCWDSSLRLEKNDQASFHTVKLSLKMGLSLCFFSDTPEKAKEYLYTLGAWHIVILGTCQINEQLKKRPRNDVCVMIKIEGSS